MYSVWEGHRENVHEFTQKVLDQKWANNLQMLLVFIWHCAILMGKIIHIVFLEHSKCLKHVLYMDKYWCSYLFELIHCIYLFNLLFLNKSHIKKKFARFVRMGKANMLLKYLDYIGTFNANVGTLLSLKFKYAILLIVTEGLLSKIFESISKTILISCQRLETWPWISTGMLATISPPDANRQPVDLLLCNCALHNTIALPDAHMSPPFLLFFQM